MDKLEAKQLIQALHKTKVEAMTKIKGYEELDNIVKEVIDRIDTLDVSKCETWQEVWELAYRNRFYVWFGNHLQAIFFTKNERITDKLIEKMAYAVAKEINKLDRAELIKLELKRIYKAGGIQRVIYLEFKFDYVTLRGETWGSLDYVYNLKLIDLEK